MRIRADRVELLAGYRDPAAGSPTVVVTDPEAAEQVRGFGANPTLVDGQTARRMRVALDELIRLGTFKATR